MRKLGLDVLEVVGDITLNTLDFSQVIFNCFFHLHTKRSLNPEVAMIMHYIFQVIVLVLNEIMYWIHCKLSLYTV